MAEISCGVYSLLSMVNLWSVPMYRLAEVTVRSGLATACLLANCPTRRSPLLENPTTDGVVRPPSALGIITGSPPSTTAIQEFVVPRSIPSTFATFHQPPTPSPHYPISNFTGIRLLFCGRHLYQAGPDSFLPKKVPFLVFLQDGIFRLFRLFPAKGLMFFRVKDLPYSRDGSHPFLLQNLHELPENHLHPGTQVGFVPGAAGGGR